MVHYSLHCELHKWFHIWFISFQTEYIIAFLFFVVIFILFSYTFSDISDSFARSWSSCYSHFKSTIYACLFIFFRISNNCNKLSLDLDVSIVLICQFLYIAIWNAIFANFHARNDVYESLRGR